MSEGKIGKNTIYLYIRSFITMVISLYTSRVILDKLGVDDFGLYNTVGSITAFLSFLTSSLALATSRYITYSIGSGDREKLISTFRTILTLYVLLALLIVLCMELVGPWFINHKIVFEPFRSFAVNAVFHLSVITVVVSMLSGPFSTLIIAHEDMNFFAYTSIFEALAKLGICYLITVTVFDRLIVYALLILAVALIMLFLNYGYAKKRYEETSLRMHINTPTLKEIGSFAGWSLIGRFSAVLSTQGVNIITNMFFGPAVVAARAISIQVKNAANTFVSNFMMAVNPQIVKRHASGNDESSNRLVQKSTVVSFVLASLICFPIVLNTEFILGVWLKEVPHYSVVFVQIILIQILFDTIENGMYSIFFSRGRVKENALVSPMISIAMFVVVYFLFKNGASPVSLSYCYLISQVLSSMLVKPLLIRQLFHYNLSFFLRIDVPCMLLLLLMAPIYVIHVLFVKEPTFVSFIIESIISVLYVLIVSYYVVIDKETRESVFTIVKLKIGRK